MDPIPVSARITQALLDLLANALFDAGRSVSIPNPTAFCLEAQTQGVFLLALQNLDIEAFPAALQAEIHAHVSRFMASNVTLSLRHAEITRLLGAAGIPHALIKGCACALWYPVPELRQLGDVDFLVSLADAARTDAALEAAGYQVETKNHRIHHVFWKDGVRFEMHIDLPGVPEGPQGVRCHAYLRELIPQAKQRSTPFGNMRLPEVFHHGLVLLLHAAHHLTGSGIGLRHLCDWAVFADTLPEETFESLFGGPLRALGLWRFACCLNAICVRYLGAKPRRWAEDFDAQTADALLEDVLAGGNLGQKNIARSHQAYLITAGKSSRSRLRRACRLLLDMIYQKWPLSKKLKILIPFGWLFYGVRYLFRAAKGKRPRLRLRAAVRAADERSGLYDRLRLFEPCGS